MMINGKRELVYIAKIKKITPIEGYDRVELAKINGWNVIVKKGDFEKGDLCVYFEVDSKVPNNDKRFDFLKNCNFKIKTKKMCGTYSQGIAMPISLFPEIEHPVEKNGLTEKLGVTHIDYEEDYRKSLKDTFGKNFLNYLYKRNILKDKKSFPYDLVNKTEEERIENINIEKLDGAYCVTEKLDGTSATYILKKKLFGYEFIICSRNKRLSKKDKNKDTEKYFSIADKYHLKEKLKCYFFLSYAKKYVGVQGEIIGEGIQGNPLDIEGQKFYAFNVIRDYKEFSPYSDFYVEKLKVPKVPLIGKIYTNRAIENIHFYFKRKDFSLPKGEEISEWKKIADINSSINPDKTAEGLVFRSPIINDIKNSNEFIYSFKNTNNSYLAK